MLLNAFDPVQGRTVILNAGDLFAEAIDVDLLVISAWDGFYQPQAGSMIATLRERCGLDVGCGTGGAAARPPPTDAAQARGLPAIAA